MPGSDFTGWSIRPAARSGVRDPSQRESDDVTANVYRQRNGITAVNFIGDAVGEVQFES
jgi:hypothetical protein